MRRREAKGAAALSKAGITPRQCRAPPPCRRHALLGGLPRRGSPLRRWRRRRRSGPLDVVLPENDVRVDKVAQRSVHGLHARLSCFDSQSCCCRCYHHFFQHGSSLAARAVAVKAELEAAAAHKCVCIKRKNLPPGAGRCCALTALKPPRHRHRNCPYPDV